MKAVRLYEYGGPENLKYEDNVPEPALSDDSVLVETSVTSVNPIDWKVRLSLACQNCELAVVILHYRVRVRARRHAHIPDRRV